jgi:hypothetical protein
MQEQPDTWTQQLNPVNQHLNPVNHRTSHEANMTFTRCGMEIDVECVRSDATEQLDSYSGSRSPSAHPSPLSESNPALNTIEASSVTDRHSLSRALHSNSPHSHTHSQTHSHSHSHSDKIDMDSTASASISPSESANMKSDHMTGRPYLPWDSDSLRSSPTGATLLLLLDCLLPFCIV